MATNTVEGILLMVDGSTVPLELDVVEGTETEITTRTSSPGGTVSALSAGDFAPNKTVYAASIQADNGVSFAYILSRGQVAAILPVCVKGVSNATQVLAGGNYTLRPGDAVQVLTLTASARNTAVCIGTTQGGLGSQRIFIHTPSGAATGEYVDLQTSNSLGDSYPTGTKIAWAYATSIDGAKVETPGAMVVDALGNVAGAMALSNPATVQPGFTNAYGIEVKLGTKMYIVTNA